MKKIHLLLTALIAGMLIFTSCQKDEFIITFNPNGGKGAIVTQTFTQKIAQPLMANPFTNPGYVFLNWNTMPDGNGVIYGDQESFMASGHLVLYAQWKPASGKFTVTFDANGGFGRMDTLMFDAGVPKKLSANAFFYKDRRFTGWNTTPNGMGTGFFNEQIITITSDLTLYAQWSPTTLQTYFVIFDANGGEGTMNPQQFIEGVPDNLNHNAFEREGHIFIGWKDDLGILYPDGVEIRIYANLRLIAQWEEIEDVDPDK